MIPMHCRHCGADFVGTPRMEKRLRYEGKAAYCSAACRLAGVQARMRRPMPVWGPCPTCGKYFESRARKVFCSLGCYVSSGQSLRNLRARGYHPKPARMVRTCVECGGEFHNRHQHKFCGRPCYRSYMAKRFDRNIASPVTLALPQNYDEFLTQDVLPCLVEGCTWRGRHLTLHMNLAHGLRSREIKRAGGFNLTTGLVALPLHLLLRETNSGKGSSAEALAELRGLIAAPGLHYLSKEGKEHYVKSRELALEDDGPPRVCLSCHESFSQTTKFGRALYCSTECRDEHYREKLRRRPHRFTCAVCKKPFQGTYYQLLRANQGMGVCCSAHCKGVLNGSRPKPKARGRRTLERPTL